MAEGYVDENGLIRWGEEHHFEQSASSLPRERDEDDDEGDDGDEEGEGDDD
jgi:hypothetical protein